MNITNRHGINGLGTYPDLIPQNNYTNDLNKVYIPFRPILEAELMVSGILAIRNYEFLSKLPFTTLDAKPVIKELDLTSDHLFSKILERLFTVMKRIVPIASELGPNLKDELRYGNVNAYTESRIPLFYAIDRLKVKLLILRDFFTRLQENHYQLSAFPSYARKADKSLYSILFSEYYDRMLKYFQTIVWEPRYKTKYLNSSEEVNFRVLYELHAHQQESSTSKINYIIRGLKSSLFISNLIFHMCDIPDPFETGNGCVESLLLNRDFIPGMINVMDMAYRVSDANKLREIVDMFLCYLDNIIEGVNNGIKIASHGQLTPEKDEILYYIGDILEF